jgi:hypothetical protein
MPFINEKFYMNPAYGRAVEFARLREQAPQKGATDHQDVSDHWVTINGQHVLIEKTQAKQPQAQRAQKVSLRDKAFLDKYYDAVAALAKKYNVDPALVLGVGKESSFAFEGTYLDTKDAFGMTGGNTKNMTTSASPAENAKQFFANYGNQIRGSGGDTSAFLNALQGRDATGTRVKGWKVYNSANPDWSKFVSGGVWEMQRAIPTYLSQRKAGSVER